LQSVSRACDRDNGYARASRRIVGAVARPTVGLQGIAKAGMTMMIDKATSRSNVRCRGRAKAQMALSGAVSGGSCNV